VKLDGSGSFDPGGAGLQYEWAQTAGPSVTLSNATAQKPSFTAPATAATLTFALTVSNGVRQSLPSSVTIAVKKAPEFTSSNATSFMTGKAGSFTITTSGNPAPAITKISGALPPGLTLVDQGDGTAALAGTPTGAAAPPGGSQQYALGLKAENTAGSVGQTLTVTVTNPGVAPAFTSPISASFTTGVAGSFTVATSGEPSAAIGVSAGSLPTGLVLTAHPNGTATISGTPAASAAEPGRARSYPLTFNASSTVGSASQSFTLTVTAPPPPPPPPSGPLQLKLSKRKVQLPVGKRSHRLVEVTAPAASLVVCWGGLPGGARCRVTAQRDVVVESSKSVKRVGTFSLTIRAAGEGGSAKRTLTVIFKPPKRRA
jgi:hypothetical protein